ncbi:MAG: sulfotransferase family protein, partial [Gammaproteobacteria bacterium]
MTEIRAQLQKIQNLIDQNRQDEALEHLQPLLITPPEQANDLYWCGQLAFILNLNRPAANLLSKAVELEPEAPHYCSMYGLLLSELDQFTAALDWLRKGVRLNPESPICHHYLGRHYYNTGQFNLAIACFRKTLSLKKDFLDAYLYLVYTLIQQTAWEAADRWVDALLQLAPEHLMGNVLKSRIEFRLHKAGSAKERLQNLLERYPDYDSGWFEYGTLLQKCKQYQEALTAFVKANDLARHDAIQADFHLEKQAKVQDATLDGLTVPPPAPLKTAPETQDTPILIIGFPRSGTTLLSAMLDQHPELHSAGELTTLPDLRTFAEQQLKAPFDLTAVNLALWSEAHLDLAELLAQSYVALQAQLRENQSISREARILDKSTANVQNLPLVARIAPKTPIINIIRDGREASWSCFTQDFTNYIWYAHHYLDAIRAWQQEIDMARRYAQAFNLNYYELHYEDLVQNPEDELR